MSEKKKILIVDDEENITRYLLRTLRVSGYEIEVANSGKDGLGILNCKHIDLIISDMLMPGMTGYDFLTIVKELYPNIIRVILSGDPEREKIIKAVADGTAQSYLTKPVGNDILKSHIGKLFKTFEALHQKKLYEVLKNNKCMQVIPSIYNKLVTMIKQDKNVEEIAEFISTDPEYAAKILQIANSSMYGLRIGSVSQAIVYLGLETVKHLVLGTEVFRSFISDGMNRSEILWIWKHSRMTNKYFHAIYRNIYSKTVPGEYNCCGLLHDTGLLLMIKQFPEQFKKIIDLTNNQKITFDNAENTVLGFNHAILGAYFLEWWNLPISIIETCMYHHDPLNSAVLNSEICSILNIADYFSLRKLNQTNYVGFDKTVFDKFGFNEKKIEGLLQSLNEND